MTPLRRIVSSLLAVALAMLGAAGTVAAQPGEIPNAAEIALALKKLQVVGSALYVAAHPDDENTALLAYWARERLVRAAYLSMTRGDGGQNLIGSEKGELMGVVRTQELLAARRIDKAQQFFTRAIDFGYSKSPEETLAIWGHDAVLADTVWVIRSFRPDVVVTRFPVTGEGGHGHHTASAQLAEAAFLAAGDPARFPEQLAFVAPWQPKRLLWNVFRFGGSARREPRPGQVTVDLGTYNPLLGRSYTEIAADSRSMHKSQGFGSAERRGSWLNDFEPRLGEPPTGDLFDGVDLSWNRIAGGAEVAALLARAEREFQPADPAPIVPLLVRAYAAMGRLGDEPLVAAKRGETLELIRACAGLWIEAIATESSAVPGGDVRLKLVALNRSRLPLALAAVETTYPHTVAAGATLPAALADNLPVATELVVKLPTSLPYSHPYWLSAPHGKGLYTVTEPELVGRPESPPALTVRFTVRSGDERLRFETPVLFRWTDPVRGEQYRPFEVAPPLTLALDETVYLFAGEAGAAAPRTVRVTARAGRPGVTAVVRLAVPPGWQVAPAAHDVALAATGEEAERLFTVTPPADAGVGTLRATAQIDGHEIGRRVVRVEYPHLPIQTLHPPAEARLVRVALRTERARVGYIMGSGDEVPDALRQLGYDVTLLSDDLLTSGDLSRFDTLVAGVRAYNTRPRLAPAHERLMAFVRAGGTYVVQYSTASDLVTDTIGPFPFKISRDRVTVEEAPVTPVAAGHPMLESPNRIGPDDFAGWVQERGLYFAGGTADEAWDPRYETVIESHDPGESAKAGGLLYARHGKGVFIYTGYAFFRQLPAGVPGALRLFVNLVSAGGAGD